MRVDLTDDPAVFVIGSKCDLEEFAVIGRLHKLWSWADKHTADGATPGVDLKWLDRFVAKQGFAEAMIAAGWLAFDGEVLSFPGFKIHNGDSAKSRCDATLRKRVSRERHAGVTNGGDKRTAIPKPFVRAVLKRDEYTCVYCGSESSPEQEAGRKAILSVDHILPVSRTSGRQAIEDLASCCRLCNGEKSDRTPEEWGLLPSFLQEGLEYKDGHILVTKTCDTRVTREEKRREESNTERESKSAPSLKEAIAAGLEQGIPDYVTTVWWEARESNGWMKGASGGAMTPVVNWRTDLSRSRTWAEEEHSKSKKTHSSKTNGYNERTDF